MKKNTNDVEKAQNNSKETEKINIEKPEVIIDIIKRNEIENEEKELKINQSKDDMGIDYIDDLTNPIDEKKLWREGFFRKDFNGDPFRVYNMLKTSNIIICKSLRSMRSCEVYLNKVIEFYFPSKMHVIKKFYQNPREQNQSKEDDNNNEFLIKLIVILNLIYL